MIDAGNAYHLFFICRIDASDDKGQETKIYASIEQECEKKKPTTQVLHFAADERLLDCTDTTF